MEYSCVVDQAEGYETSECAQSPAEEKHQFLTLRLRILINKGTLGMVTECFSYIPSANHEQQVAFGPLI